MQRHHSHSAKGTLTPAADEVLKADIVTRYIDRVLHEARTLGYAEGPDEEGMRSGYLEFFAGCRSDEGEG